MYIYGHELNLYQARRTLFKTGTASVASNKTEMGVWGALLGGSPLRKFLGVLDALS